MDWKNKPHQIFNKIKHQMFAKGVQNFRFVHKMIEQFDPENTGLLTPHFFNLFTNKIGVFLTTQEIRNIRDLYCRGTIFIQMQIKKQHIEIYLKMLNIRYHKKLHHLFQWHLINQIQMEKVLSIYLILQIVIVPISILM